MSAERTGAGVLPVVAVLTVMWVPLVAGCGGESAPSAAAPVAPAAIEIGPENLVEVKQDTISVGPLISGELRAAREARVRAEIGGTVLSVSVDVGQQVRRGASLARIETRTLDDEVTSADAGVRSAEQALAIARTEQARNERLVKAGALPERELETSSNAQAAAEAALEAARARLASAKRNLQDASVLAPIAGLVSARQVSAGDVVSPGTELVTIIDPSSMRLEASVPSESLAAVQVGAQVAFEVRGYPDERFTGTIDRVSPVADPTTRQVPIFVEIPNAKGRLIAGLFAEGRVARESRTGLVVPAAALAEANGQTWAMRLRDGKAERVEVGIGLRDEQNERVEVTSGLQEGDRLLVGALQALAPGTPVTLQESRTNR